jgi:hypothetical protein
LDTGFAGSNLDEDDEFLMEIKIRSLTSLGGEVKLSVHVVSFYGTLNNPIGMKRDTSYAKFMAISLQVSPALLPDVSANNCRRALVDESGMIRTQMGMHNRSEMVAVLGAPCAIPN